MRAYLITASLFAVTAVIMFATSHPFIGTLAIAGMAVSGAAILVDNLPSQDNREDDDDLTGI